MARSSTTMVSILSLTSQGHSDIHCIQVGRPLACDSQILSTYHISWIFCCRQRMWIPRNLMSSLTRPCHGAITSRTMNVFRRYTLFLKLATRLRTTKMVMTGCPKAWVFCLLAVCTNLTVYVEPRIWQWGSVHVRNVCGAWTLLDCLKSSTSIPLPPNTVALSITT